MYEITLKMIDDFLMAPAIAPFTVTALIFLIGINVAQLLLPKGEKGADMDDFL
jgi:hypothetical protein